MKNGIKKNKIGVFLIFGLMTVFFLAFVPKPKALSAWTASGIGAIISGCGSGYIYDDYEAISLEAKQGQSGTNTITSACQTASVEVECGGSLS